MHVQVAQQIIAMTSSGKDFAPAQVTEQTNIKVVQILLTRWICTGACSQHFVQSLDKKKTWRIEAVISAVADVFGNHCLQHCLLYRGPTHLFGTAEGIQGM